MKKTGFTLAEVLITLGIIGVVAALTAPALMQDAGNAKIGPTLSKTASTIAVANENLLHHNEIGSLRRLGQNVGAGGNAQGHISDYTSELVQHLAGATIIIADYPEELSIRNIAGVVDADRSVAGYNGTNSNFVSTILMPNGVTVTFDTNVHRDGIGHYAKTINDRGSFIGYNCEMMVDINGPNTRPNRYGQDIFFFALDNSGSVVPYGSEQFRWLTDEDFVWTNNNDYGCSDGYVGTGIGCAGSVFDNNFKVIYK